MTPPPLSELVRYANRLDQLSLDQLKGHVKAELAAMDHVITADPGVGFSKINHRVSAASQRVNDELAAYEAMVTELRRRVQDTIDAYHTDYLDRSLRLFQQEMIHETADYILSRTLNCVDSDRELITGKILRYADWRVPGLMLRPARESWIDHLVSLDPLYLMDTNPALLDPALQRFSAEYRARLRPYVVTEQVGHAMLQRLPDGQFGYVFAYNFLNYKPWPIVSQYISELWQKLRPGGTLFFTFNDCDRFHGVALTEQNFMCYTPASMLITHARDLGFELLDYYSGQADVSWLELRRPGKMRSIKGAQTLAEIRTQSK